MAVGPDGYEFISRLLGKGKYSLSSVCLILNIKSAKLYQQEVNIFKLGRMPLNCVVDIRRTHSFCSLSVQVHARYSR